MANLFWPKALTEACFYAYHPGLHSRTPESIVSRFLWHWGHYPPEMWPVWEALFLQGHDDNRRFEQDIFPLLQRATREGKEEERVFALFLLGALATLEARDLLSSFLTSEYRKERWASAIALGRLKEERAFPLLRTLLLEGFWAKEIFASDAELQTAEEICRAYRQTGKEQERAAFSQAYWHIIELLESIDYEWYLRQRSEIALILGTWGTSVVIPELGEALQAACKMEQIWPDYEGPDESGPQAWLRFQDRLAFALGQLGVWDALLPLHIPEAHLLVARIYLILGYLQIRDPAIFFQSRITHLFCDLPQYLQDRTLREKAGEEVDPFIEPVDVKQLLAAYFDLSPAEQESYLERFPKAWNERTEERVI